MHFIRQDCEVIVKVQDEPALDQLRRDASPLLETMRTEGTADDPDAG